MSRRVRSTAVSAVLWTVVTAASAAPAWAGGIGTVGDAAFDNTCVRTGAGPEADVRQPRQPGLLGGNVNQAPVAYSKNSCGSTDIDVDTTS
ncbi:hypothetical protein [Streptomyces sp. NPDC006368]|uniref:hypothetical protein n=1 Tax=Streptomyces sp. NPDC006368 TaxID=3156760 RepID=UPI0033AE50A5